MEAPSASTSSFSPGHHYPAAVAKYSTPIVATAPRQQLPSPSSTFHSHLPQPSPASPYRLCTMSTIRYEYDENLPPPSSSHAPQLVNRPSPISPPTSLLASEMQIIHADFATDELDDFVNDHAGDRSFDLARYVTAHNDEGDGEWNRENLLLHNCTPSIDPTLMGDDKLVSIINDVASLPPNQVALLPAVHRHSSYHPSPFAVIGGNNQQPLQSAGEVQGVHYFHQRHRHRSEKQGLTGGDDNDENAGPGMDTTYHPRPAAYGETYCVLSTSSSDYHPLQLDQRLHHSLPHHSQHPQHNVPVFHQQHVIVSGGDEEPEEEFLLAPEDFVANEEDSQHSDFIADSSFSAQGEGTQLSTSNKRGTKRRSDEVSTHSGDSGGGNGSGGGGSGGTRRQQPKTGNVDEQQIAGGFIKPSYSYSCLIGLALKNSTSGELTVSEIYAFLCEHFPFFRAAPGGWKNSVRHNLSLNKCFQKIEVETPGCQGRKSCLWRLNPAKEAKMDLELRKWRDRYEPTILKSMCNPDDLDSIQNGTKGMPPTMRRRIFATSDENYTATVKTVQPKIIRRLPLHPSSTSSNRPGFSTPLAAASTSSNATNKLASGGGSGASRREDAARKLELLLQQTKSGQFETSPPLAPKRSSTGSRHSSSSTSSQHFQVKTSPPDFNISVSTPTHGAPSSQHQHEKKSRAHSKECKQEICQSDMSVLLPMSLLESRDDHLHHGTPLSRGEFHSPFGESTTSHHRIFSGRLVVRSGGESRALRMEDANCYTLQTTPKGEVSPMGEGGLESPAPSGRRLPQSRFNTPSTSFASSYDIATDAINNNSLLELEGLNTPSSNPSLRREPLREIKKEIP